MEARVIPAVAYTDTEVAWVGLTEVDAKRAGVSIEKAIFPWAASGRSLALGRDEGFTKLLFGPGTRRLLGAGVVGTGAGESESALPIPDLKQTLLCEKPHAFMLRRSKDEVLSLPSKNEHRIVCSMSPEEVEKHHLMSEGMGAAGKPKQKLALLHDFARLAADAVTASSAGNRQAGVSA